MKKSAIAYAAAGLASAVLIGGIAWVLVGPAALERYADQAVKAEMRQAIADTTRDPAAAQIRKERFLAQEAVKPYMRNYILCAEVNGKNAYGGYTGFQEAIAYRTGAEKPEVYANDMTKGSCNAVFNPALR